MKKSILLLCIIAITGCDKVVSPTGTNSANALTRYVDKENGVTCYQDAIDRRAFSCVKLSAGEKK